MLGGARPAAPSVAFALPSPSGSPGPDDESSDEEQSARRRAAELDARTRRMLGGSTSTGGPRRPSYASPLAASPPGASDDQLMRHALDFAARARPPSPGGSPARSPSPFDY